MSAAKRKRVAGDAERARVSACFKDAVRKAFSHEPFLDGRARLTSKNTQWRARLPFVDEFSSFPVLLRPAGRCAIRRKPVTPLSVVSMARAFLEPVDAESVADWHFNARCCVKSATERELADHRLACNMGNTLEAIKTARAASLRAFCANEFDAWIKARDACVARMMEWEAADVDVEKFIETLDDN